MSQVYAVRFIGVFQILHILCVFFLRRSLPRIHSPYLCVCLCVCEWNVWGPLILSSCVEGIVGGWGCWINHMWLWPAQPAPDMEQEGGREAAFPLMNGTQSNLI